MSNVYTFLIDLNLQISNVYDCLICSLFLADQEPEAPIQDAGAAQNQVAVMPTAQDMGSHVTSHAVADTLTGAESSPDEPDDSSTEAGAGREQHATTSTLQQSVPGSSAENSPSQQLLTRDSHTPSQEAAPSQDTDRAVAQPAQLEEADSERQKPHGGASTSSQQPPVDSGQSEHEDSHKERSTSSQQQPDGQCQDSDREASTISSKQKPA